MPSATVEQKKRLEDMTRALLEGMLAQGRYSTQEHTQLVIKAIQLAKLAITEIDKAGGA